MFGRFALDGKQQTLWSRNIRTGTMQAVAEPALRPIHIDSTGSRLYYVYQQDLHLRNLKSSSDWVIANSVTEGNFLRSIPGP
jgi:hypothetical protein